MKRYNQNPGIWKQTVPSPKGITQERQRNKYTGYLR